MRFRSLILAVLIFGCSQGGPPGPPFPPSDVKLTIGTADPRTHTDLRWVDLVEEEQGVELYPGSQGGFHIWLHYRLLGASGRVHVHRIADRVDREDPERRDRVLTTDAFMTILAPEDGEPMWMTESPIPNFMCPTPIGINVIDQLIEMILRIETEEGQMLVETRARVVPRCPPQGDGQHEFCKRICSG